MSHDEDSAIVSRYVKMYLDFGIDSDADVSLSDSASRIRPNANILPMRADLLTNCDSVETIESELPVHNAPLSSIKVATDAALLSVVSSVEATTSTITPTGIAFIDPLDRSILGGILMRGEEQDNILQRPLSDSIEKANWNSLLSSEGGIGEPILHHLPREPACVVSEVCSLSVFADPRCRASTWILD
jgi:hypothetical protein